MQNIHGKWADHHIQMQILHHCRQEMWQFYHQCTGRCFDQQTNEWRSSQVQTGCTSPKSLAAIESEAQWSIIFLPLINFLLTTRLHIQNTVIKLSLHESCGLFSFTCFILLIAFFQLIKYSLSAISVGLKWWMFQDYSCPHYQDVMFQIIINFIN
jgi:hypothetical protein